MLIVTFNRNKLTTSFQLPFKFSRYLPTKEKVEYPGSEQLARDDTLGVEAAPTTILCFWKWLQASK